MRERPLTVARIRSTFVGIQSTLERQPLTLIAILLLETATAPTKTYSEFSSFFDFTRRRPTFKRTFCSIRTQSEDLLTSTFSLVKRTIVPQKELAWFPHHIEPCLLNNYRGKCLDCFPSVPDQCRTSKNPSTSSPLVEERPGGRSWTEDVLHGPSMPSNNSFANSSPRLRRTSTFLLQFSMRTATPRGNNFPSRPDFPRPLIVPAIDAHA